MLSAKKMKLPVGVIENNAADVNNKIFIGLSWISIFVIVVTAGVPAGSNAGKV